MDLILFHIARIVFVLVNISLLYVFLTPKQCSIKFQFMAFLGTTLLHLGLREILASWGWEPFLIGYLLATFYLLPISLIFRETMSAKIFVVFMILSFSQFNFLFFLFLEQIFYQKMFGGLILLGQLVALGTVPYVRGAISQHFKNIIEIINQKSRIFTILPVASFVLLAFYGVQRKYLLSTLIPLVLATMIVFFSYYLIGISIEQTKRHKNLEERLQIDYLTGLYNRHYMEKLINAEYDFNKNKVGNLALIIVDVDLFKNINDKYGHAGGDVVLQEVAEDLRVSVRNEDKVARWGGDEFIIMLPQTDKKKASNIAEKIRQNIATKEYQYETFTFQVTVTLGVYISAYSNEDGVEEVIKKADMLMYQGKRTGRNSVVCSEESI